MKEINKRQLLFFRVKEIWFADKIFDIDWYSSVIYRCCQHEATVCGYEHFESMTLVIDLTWDIKDIWSAFKASSCRYEINRASKYGIDVKLNQKYREFCDIYKVFRKNKKLHASLSFSPKFFMENGVLFIAELNGEVLGGIFLIEDENVIRWVVGASKRLHVVDRAKARLIGCANRLMLWEAIKYAKNKGKKIFDFGGYAVNPGADDLCAINMFKKSWGGAPVMRHDYVKDYSWCYRVCKKIYGIYGKIVDRIYTART